MKKIAALLTLLTLCVPVMALAQESSDDAILALLKALDGPVAAPVSVAATTTAPAAPKPAAKPKDHNPEIVGPTIPMMYLFNIGGASPVSSQAQSSDAQGMLAALSAQLAALKNTATTSATTASTTPEKPKAPTFNRNLTVGARGADVIALQRILIDGGYMVGETTGYFGVMTKTAVIALQTDQGIDATGFVGPKTRALLNSTDPKTFVHVAPAQADPASLPTTIMLLQSASLSASSTDATSTAATSTSPVAGPSFNSGTSTAPSGTAATSTPPGPVSVSFSVTPTTVPMNGKSVATWATLNATSCQASGAWEGAFPVQGTAVIGPVRSTIDLILTCSGPGGMDSTTATIVVGDEQ